MPQELLDTLQKINRNYLSGLSLTDLAIGTVTTFSPSPFNIQVTIEGTMQPIPKEAIRLSQSVIPKVLNIAPHTHQYQDYDEGSPTTRTTEPAFDFITCVENGETLDGAATQQVTINRGLRVGDKVLMLRVLNGQNFIILSRVYSL